MAEAAKTLYTPALGSQAAIGMAHIRTMHPAPVSGSDLAELLGCDSKNVFQAMRRCVEYGLIKLNKVGARNMYQLTEHEAVNGQQAPEVSAEQLQAYAKRAVIMLRGQTKSSVDLAAWCNTTPAIVDKALAAHVDAGHLVRVDVLRGGQTMFDYRWGATYVPKDADFGEGCSSGQAPEPRVQPVQDKAPTPKPTKAPGAPKNPASPWRKEGSLRLPGTLDFGPRDALQTGANLGKQTPDTRGVADLANDLRVAGFTTSSVVHDDQITVPDFKQQDAQAMLGWQIEKAQSRAVPEEPTDDTPWPEFSITNRGFMVITNGVDVVELEPKEALALKRFLDNTSILEELSAGGAL